jgi:hypothetical protein
VIHRRASVRPTSTTALLPAASSDSRRPRTPRGSRALVATLVLGLAALAACGDDPAATEADDLSAFRERAASAGDAPWAARYALEQGSGGSAEVVITRVPDSLRLDVDVDDARSTLIVTSSGTVACTTSTEPTGSSTDPTCLQVAGPDATPPPALDPGLTDVVGDGLDRLGEGFGTVEVLGVQDEVSADALCARVSGNDVPAGVYCLLPDGVPASVNFPSGSIKLTERLEEPNDAAFTPPASPRPAR